MTKHYIIEDESWFDGDWEMECYNHPEFNGSMFSIEDVEQELLRLQVGKDPEDFSDFLEDSTHEDVLWALKLRRITYEIVGTRTWKTDAEKLDKLSKFPVELRKMWTGQEVQEWIDNILEDE